MWVFLPSGFISVVQHRDNSNNVVVRAREREHLVAFLELLAGNPARVIIRTPNADYEYRTIIERLVFERCMLKAIRSIDYPNFKSDAAAYAHARRLEFPNNREANAYVELLHGIWHEVKRALDKRPRAKPLSKST